MKPTQEQVIAWAREAGLWPAVTDTFPSEAERFACLAYEAGRKDENEACAALCDTEANREELDGDETLGARYGAYCCAIAIRERGAP